MQKVVIKIENANGTVGEKSAHSVQPVILNIYFMMTVISIDFDNDE